MATPEKQEIGALGLLDIEQAVNLFKPHITRNWIRTNPDLPRARVGKKDLFRAEDIAALISPPRRGPGRPMLRKSGAKMVPQRSENSENQQQAAE